MFLPKEVLKEKLLSFLKEDLGLGDITTFLSVPETTIAEAEIVSRESGIVAGIDEIRVLCEILNLDVNALKQNSAKVESGTVILRLIGSARTLLSAERTLLNLLSRMSGIATKTNLLVRKARSAKYEGVVACTRKVAPGLGFFDKKAVLLGGGDTHRLHLDDLILVKDNHIRICGDIASTIKKIRKDCSFTKKVEVEVASVEDAVQAAQAGVDIIMLDNFSPNDSRRAVAHLEEKGLRSKVLLEVSGGVTQHNMLKYATTGVDIISVGEITHSVKALDMSLKVVKVR